MSARPARGGRRGILGTTLALVTATAAAVSLTVLEPATATASPAASRAAAKLCNGLPVTQTGSPGAVVTGTSGDDVIITQGASLVDTGAGDDSICVTGKGKVVVNAGLGDDFVGTRAHQGKSFVSLGFGDDVFWGGTGADRVWSQEASNQTAPDDHDEISTGGGPDYVISGSSAAGNTDIVVLGPGNDTLATYGATAGAYLDGGSGFNTLQPLFGSDLSGSWTVDNTVGRADLAGVTRLSWLSFQRFLLGSLEGDLTTFVGSKSGEWVVAGGTCRAVLRGGGGDDQLTVTTGCHSLPAGDSRLLGGPGNDRLQGSAGDDILHGGPGTDWADGREGSDKCRAETRLRCEQ